MAKVKAKKSEVVVETKKDIKRKEKEIKRKNRRELSETEREVVHFVILLAVVIAIVGLSYVLTNATKKKNSDAPVDYSIQYDEINVGMLLNRNEYSEYYVLAYDVNSKNHEGLYQLYKTYQNRDNVTKLYTLNLTNGVNDEYYNKEGKSKLDVTKVTDIVFNTDTLLHIKKGKIVKSYTKMDDIEKILK